MTSVPFLILDASEVILTASRSEAFRYVRLSNVLSAVEGRIAADDVGQWSGALRHLNDWKGALTAVWRSQSDLDRFAHLISQAWAEAGEEPDLINHETVAP